MATRARLIAVASFLACACEGRAPDPATAPAPAPAHRGADPADASRAERVGDRRGDRHARAPARRRPTVKRARGTIARASDRLVVIRPVGVPELSLRVTPATRVTVDGRPARSEALREGTEVRASYRLGDGGGPTAVWIETERPAQEARRR